MISAPHPNVSRLEPTRIEGIINSIDLNVSGRELSDSCRAEPR